MERNFPDILHNRQTEVVFVPETHLPKLPHIVDLPEFQAKKARLSDEELAATGLKKSGEDIAAATGDLVEKELFDALKAFYRLPTTNKKVVVLQGFTLRALTGFPGIRENDFVIIDHERKAIICIEAKTTLTNSAGHKAVRQTQELKERFEAFFASELASGDWAFVGMIYTNKIRTSQPLCPDCRSFVIEGPSELHLKLSAVDNVLQPKR